MFKNSPEWIFARAFGRIKAVTDMEHLKDVDKVDRIRQILEETNRLISAAVGAPE